MDITTKFQIGDTVWTVKDNKAYSFEVIEIKITIDYIDKQKTESKTEIVYYEKMPKNDWKPPYYERRQFTYEEKYLAWSKEELINLL